MSEKYITLVRACELLGKSNTSYFYNTRLAKDIKKVSICGVAHISEEDLNDLQESITAEKDFKLDVTVFAEWIGRTKGVRKLVEGIYLDDSYEYTKDDACLRKKKAIEVLNRYDYLVNRFLKEYSDSGIRFKSIEFFAKILLPKRPNPYLIKEKI